MTVMYTTYGIFVMPKIESGYQSGPSVDREEQIKRLEALKSVKGKREKWQMENDPNKKK